MSRAHLGELLVSSYGITESPRAATLTNPEKWLIDWVGGGSESDTGQSVTWKTSLGLSAVWYCVNRISSDVAQMELELYRETGEDETDEDETHPAGRLVRQGGDNPVTPFHLRKLVQAHALLEGNGRAYIVRDRNRIPLDWIPLPSDTQTITIYDTAISQRMKWHLVYPDYSRPKAEIIPLPDQDVLHIFGLSHDGYTGLSPLDALRNALGEGLSQQKVSNTFYKNNAVPGLILEAPPGAFRNEQDAQSFLERFNAYHRGQDNAGRAGLLREGIKATVLSVSQRDAQILESRQFDVRAIMRIFGIPHIPGVTDSTSYNTLEQLNRAYLLHCLGPWLKAWTTECDQKLLTEREREDGTLYFEFATWDLVKPDALQRSDMLTKLVQGMIITSNEARDWEGLPPLPGGDTLRNPATTQAAAGGGGNQTPPTPPPAPPPAQSKSTVPLEAAILSGLQHMLAEESARVREMTLKARNYCDWLEAYYGKHREYVASRMEAHGAEPEAAAAWIDGHKQDLLQAAGAAKSLDALFEELRSITCKWAESLPELAATIAARVKREANQ